MGANWQTTQSCECVELFDELVRLLLGCSGTVCQCIELLTLFKQGRLLEVYTVKQILKS